MKRREQLGLFGAAEAPPEPANVGAAVAEVDEVLARRLPSFVRFGTSSWTFPGWAGLVYSGAPSEATLAARGLSAYAEHPLLRAVGLDRSFYEPLQPRELTAYRAQIAEARARRPDLPPFVIVPKVWETITTAIYPRHPRYGARAGQPNPSFLDPARFVADVLAPARPALGEACGPFVLSLTPWPRGSIAPSGLYRRVDAFLRELQPLGLRFAFELRNAELLEAAWFRLLGRHGAAHAFTYWTAMPSLRVQLARSGGLRAPFTVVRLMLPPFTRYEERRAAYAPFDTLLAPQPEMRDDVLAILRAAAHAGGEAFVIVNNKAEGCAPLTIRALAERVARELG